MNIEFLNLSQNVGRQATCLLPLDSIGTQCESSVPSFCLRLRGYLDLASEIWWHGKVCLFEGNDKIDQYEFALTRPLKEIIPLIASQDPVTQVIIEWRLKHGQDL